MKNILYIILAIFLTSCNTPVIDKIHDNITKSEETNKNLEYLTQITPARMSGSLNNAMAVEYLRARAEFYEADQVWLQEVEIPYWEAGDCSVILEDSTELHSIPLGLSVGTNGKDITASVVEIKNIEELDRKDLKNKIVFFNQPMDATQNGYSKAGWQRVNGPVLASEKGAKAVIIRSITTILSDDPHTGVTWYNDSIKQIPAIAISTNDANYLSEALSDNPNLKLTINSTSKRYKNATGNNLIAEIRGSKKPENVMLITAHIDSWFNSEGAQDNATGCIQVLEIIRVFKELKIKPNNTIRVLIYQDEEMELSGIKEYAGYIKNSNEKHLFDLEIDAGAGKPENFILFDFQTFVDSISPILFENLKAYGLKNVEGAPISEAEFWPLTKDFNIPVYFYSAERNDYFDIHHSKHDNLQSININSLKEGAAAIASFVYLMDGIMEQ